MKLTKKMRATAVSLALLFSVTVSVIAVSAYDGMSDPIISLSYLQQYTAQNVDPKIQALQSQISELKSMVDLLTAGGAQTPSVSPDAFSVVQLQYGQKVIAGESCEIILRSGTANVVLDAASLGGISDLTQGVDLTNGTSVTPNHYLLVPRNDGRGIYITSDVAFIMIKGAYTIE